MDSRIPPHNAEAEKSVIGAILLDSESFTRIADSLRPHHFYIPQHAIIFETIAELFQKAKPIDIVTLTSALKAKKKLNEAGGSAYLAELTTSVPTAAHIEEYSRLVNETSTRRSMITYAGQLAELARVEDRPIEVIMDEMEGNLFSLSQDNTQNDFFDASTLLEMHFEKTEEYSKNPNALRGIPTGKDSLDKILGGFHNSDLVILAARPSVGKSAFITDVARYAATREDKSIAIFSLEMPGLQVIERMLAQEINVSLYDLRMGRMSDEAYARFAEGAGRLSKAKIFVDETAGLNIMQLRSKARKLKMQKGLDMIIIDYLQLMQSMNISRSDNRASEVSEISRSLKLLARELGVPVIALSQLNRSVESRTDHRPQLSDLRESGSIEQDADVVIFLSREKLFNPESERPDSVDVIIAKHRNGPIGMTELRFEEQSTRFVDLA